MRTVRITLALALFLPSAGRAFLGGWTEPGPVGDPRFCAPDEDSPFREGGGRRPVLMGKVEKLALRSASPLDGKLIEERLEVDAVAAVHAALPVAQVFAELTKPDSLRIFLSGTPHNHRAPPSA